MYATEILVQIATLASWASLLLLAALALYGLYRWCRAAADLIFDEMQEGRSTALFFALAAVVAGFFVFNRSF